MKQCYGSMWYKNELPTISNTYPLDHQLQGSLGLSYQTHAVVNTTWAQATLKCPSRYQRVHLYFTGIDIRKLNQASDTWTRSERDERREIENINTVKTKEEREREGKRQKIAAQLGRGDRGGKF